MKIAQALALATLLATSSACAHRSYEGQRKAAYEDDAEDRLDAMRENLDKLKQRSAQLLGTPRQQLDQAIDRLQGELAKAGAELKELEDRSPETWVEKKELVDRQLFAMDEAYGQALRVLTAH